MKEIWKQTWRDIRRQPLLSVLTIVGTAVSIALIMIMVMSLEALTADYGNEPNRSRSLYIGGICDNDDPHNMGYWGLGPTSIEAICSQPSDLIEHVAITPTFYNGNVNIIVGTKSPVKAQAKAVGDGYFDVYRFNFLAGRPFTHEEHVGCQSLAIISESLARKLFGSVEEAMGKEMNLYKSPFRVTGVVSDVSPLMSYAYGEVWLPANFSHEGDVNNPHLRGVGVGGFSDGIQGGGNLTLVAPHKSDLPKLKEEVHRRIRVMADMLKQDSVWLSEEHRWTPDFDKLQLVNVRTQEELNYKDEPQLRTVYGVIFAVLLVVPAINLASMTQSRMRQRRAEISIRRAFGAKRRDILARVFTESLFVTLLGGILGLLVAILLIALNGTGAMIAFDQAVMDGSNTMVDMSLLLDPWVYLWTLIFCFVLNLLSSLLPAWRASRTDIVKSLK